jgi:predicted transposase/invertase (TIGR01784 family)
MRFRSDTPVGIDPRVDVVFKKLFGDPEHERVRLRFLNDVLAPAVPITRAEVRNPFNLAEFEGDRSIVLDIEATDETGRVFQVEMQRRVDRNLSRRMLYDWSRVYSSQLREGDSFAQLRPVVSVWLCDEDAFPSAQGGHLRFQLLERREGIPLVGDLQIEVLQLRRWIRDRASLTNDPAWTWFCFMNEASGWREVPPWIDNVALEEAMEILDKFRSDVALSHLYRARVEAERIERGRQEELEEARAEAAEARAGEERERQEKERALQEREQALAELAALKAKYGLS